MANQSAPKVTRPIGKNWPININTPGVHTFQKDELPRPLIELHVK